MNYLRYLVAMVLSMVFTLSVSAEITVSGKVTDSMGNPLDALVTVLSDGVIEGFSNADDNGVYSITFEPSASDIVVRVSLFGFDTVEQMVEAKTQVIDIVMDEGGVELKEVTVVADKITENGDTISYRVGAYKDANDRVIGDVIKKMPGLEVSESGRISFNGKTVKNFYVEDMDLLEGRYGIATNNISANDVASVQVYQNHQPIRALQDWNPTDDVTINLKLKSSARGTFSFNGMAGVGYKPAMWAAEAVAMYFGKGMQTITTYKGNNCGDNVSAEQNKLTDDGGVRFFNKAPLSVVSPESPGVPLKRYLGNRSNTISTNNIFRLDSLSTLNLSLAYLDDVLRKEGEVETEQYLPSGNYRWISQRITNKSYIHRLNGSATYKNNTSSFYLANSLNVDAAWNKDRAHSVTSASFMSDKVDVAQRLDNPSFSIDDRLSLILNQERREWNLEMGVGWNRRPQSLTVGPTSVFGESAESEVVNQEYTTDDFRGEVKTGMSYKFGKAFLNTFIFGNVDIENVSTDLTGFDSKMLPAIANDYTFGKGELGVEPCMGYPFGDFYVELRLPAGYSIQWLRDRLDADRNRAWNYLNLNPVMRFTYKAGKSWWELNSSYYRMRDNSGRASTGVVMTDYLSFREFLIEKTLTDKTWYTTLGYHYSNAMIQFFGNAEGGWLRSGHNTISGYGYDGLVTVSNVCDIPYVSHRYFLKADISKGLRFWESTLKLGCNWSLNKGRQLIDMKAVDYKANYWSTNLMVATVPAEWMGAALGFAYSENRSYTALNRRDAMTVSQYTGRLDLNFFPISRLVVNVAVEDNYTNMTSTGRHAWFGDIKLKYKTGRLDWELEFNNIFNRRQFTRVNYNDINIYRNTVLLRPRNIMLKLRFNLR